MCNFLRAKICADKMTSKLIIKTKALEKLSLTNNFLTFNQTWKYLNCRNLHYSGAVINLTDDLRHGPFKHRYTRVILSFLFAFFNST